MIKPENIPMPSSVFKGAVADAVKKNAALIRKHSELFANARKLDVDPELMRQAALSSDHARTLVEETRANLAGRKLLVDTSAARLSVEIARSKPKAGHAFGIDLAQLSKRLAVVLDSLDTNTQPWKEALASMTQYVERYQPMFAQMQRAADAFIEVQRDLDERADGFVLRHGWPIPLRLQPRLFGRIVGLADASKREVNAMMKQTFLPGTRAHAMTREVLLESPHFRSRRVLLQQALKALARGEWYLVINALLPLVEGVLVDVVYANDEVPHKARAQKSVKRLQQIDGALFYSPLVRSLEVMLIPAGAGVALFDGFDHGNYGVPGEPQSLNRNAILHGAARRYGSQQNALKLYLLLVMMAELLERYDQYRLKESSS